MIKSLSLILAFTLLASGASAQSFKSPDILVDTKLEADWTGMLISKIRRILRNKGLADPFKKKFEKPFVVNKSEVQQFLNPEAKELLGNLGYLLKMDFLKAESKAVIHGLQYTIKDFKTKLQLKDESANSVSIAADFAASKVRVQADKIVLSLVIPGTPQLPVIEIEVLNPNIQVTEESILKFAAYIRLSSNKESFKLQLEQANFDDLAHSLLDTKNVKLDFKVVVPKVSLKVGNKELKFDQKKIEELIYSKKEGIKGILLAEFSKILSNGLVADVFKATEKVGFDKEYWIESSTIQTYLKINSFKSFTDKDHVLTQLDGDFCTLESYVAQKKECLNNKPSPAPKSRLTERDHTQSLDAIRDLIEEGDANIVASISEDYINKVLFTTLDAGLWDEKLKASGVRLGPNRPFIRLDEKGSATGTLYMDMLFTPTRFQQIALGTREVRFPLVMKVGLRITNDIKVPIFTIHTAQVDTSDEILLRGKPEIGVISNIGKLRLKHKVIATIREQTASLADKDIVSLRYPEFRGLDLEMVDFTSDGVGRMNALIRLKNSVDADLVMLNQNNPSDA